MRTLLVPVLLLTPALLGQEAKEGKAGDAQKLVTIREIVAEGSRLPSLSVVRMTGIKIGDQVNFIKLQGAIQKLVGSGLIKSVDFEYESLPGKETDVILHLLCTDVKPTARASIQISKVDEADVWTWLAQVDPLFTREMPPNEAAIRLYSNWIAKYMESHGDPSFQANFAILADASNSAGGVEPDRLLFKVVKRRGVR